MKRSPLRTSCLLSNVRLTAQLGIVFGELSIDVCVYEFCVLFLFQTGMIGA